MFTFEARLSNGRDVTGFAFDKTDLAKMSVGGAALGHLGDRLIMFCLGTESEVDAALIYSDRFDGPVRITERGAAAWTCGHLAGSACAVCYHTLAAKAADLAIQNEDFSQRLDELEGRGERMADPPAVILEGGGKGRKN